MGWLAGEPCQAAKSRLVFVMSTSIQKSPEPRQSTAARGYGSKWQKARAAWLVSHPTCVECAKVGRVSGATVVDHIKAPRLGAAMDSGDAALIAEARRLFWLRDNWQSLCKFCHDSYKQRVEKSGQEPGCDVAGVPHAAGHHWNV